MPKGREYELKFSLAPEATERLIAHPRLQAALANRQTSRLVSTYFDTPDTLLRRKRVSLRVRQSDAGTTQTLKGPGASIVDRAEWEHASSGSRPDVAWLRSTPLKSLFKEEDVTGALEPRFTVEVSRTTCPIALDDATLEGALDQGAIRARNLSLPVNEFELELVAGADASVMAFARALAADLPLVLSLVTKAERGYGVADLTWGRPTKTLQLDLSAVRTIADGFAAVTQACLHAICRNAALIGTASDTVEAVHKTRIALRHLRAAFRLFEPVLRRRGFKALWRELKWISDKLGAARDADVFQHVFNTAAQANEPAGGAAVAELMRDHQRQAHRRLRKALASPRWRLLLLDLLAVSADGVRRGKRKARCAPFVRGQLAAHHHSLARRTRSWSRRSDEALHDVRKHAKMLRYDLDLLGDLPKLGVRRRTLRQVGDDLQTLQQTLGEAHDRIAMREHLGDVILRRSAPPPGSSDEEWDALREAARHLAGSSPQDNAALGHACKAARRLRRRTL